MVTAQLICFSTCHFSGFYQSAYFFLVEPFLSFSFFFSPPILRVSGLAISVSGVSVPQGFVCFFFCFFFSPSIFHVSGLAIPMPRSPGICMVFFLFFFLVLQFFVYLAVPSRCLGCLSGDFWPKHYNFQSAQGAFRVTSGLNVTTFNQH